MLIHSQSSRESFPGLCKNYAARKRVFSVSLRFAPFILPVFMGWGKRQIPLISPWLASVILQNFEFPHPFPSNSKQCREFSLAQGQRSQFIPLYSPTHSPGWPGVLPQGQADDMCIRKTNLSQAFLQQEVSHRFMFTHETYCLFNCWLYGIGIRFSPNNLKRNWEKLFFPCV